MIVQQAGSALLYFSAALFTLTFLYALTGDRRSEVARVLLLLLFALALVLDLVSFRNLFGDSGLYSVMRVFAFGLVPISGIAYLVTMVKWRRRGAREQKAAPRVQ